MLNNSVSVLEEFGKILIEDLAIITQLARIAFSPTSEPIKNN